MPDDWFNQFQIFSDHFLTKYNSFDFELVSLYPSKEFIIENGSNKPQVHLIQAVIISPKPKEAQSVCHTTAYWDKQEYLILPIGSGGFDIDLEKVVYWHDNTLMEFSEYLNIYNNTKK